MKLLSLLVGVLLVPANHCSGLSSIWRHSPKIKKDGFFTEIFPVEGVQLNMLVRQVPGDGNCLFHAISACLDYTCNGTHPSLDLNDLMPKSASLREVAVDYLVENLKKSLYLEKDETVPVHELLRVVAAQYNMTAEHYCEVMRQSSVWGGGPEIVALSNALCRPIHVYELASSGVRFCFKRMACFGSPCFDEKEAIHILSADSRFPNLKPGKQLANGNHFLALFPRPETIESEGGHGGGIRGGRKPAGGGAGGEKVGTDQGDASTSQGGGKGGLSLWLKGLWSNFIQCKCIPCFGRGEDPGVDEAVRGGGGEGIVGGDRPVIGEFDGDGGHEGGGGESSGVEEGRQPR